MNKPNPVARFRETISAPSTVLSSFANTTARVLFKRGPQTDMFTDNEYDNRIVGYLKVNVKAPDAKRFGFGSVKAGAITPYWFEVNVSGQIMGKTNDLAVKMPPNYQLNMTTSTTVTDEQIQEFARFTGLTIDNSDLRTKTTELETTGLTYKSNEKKSIGTPAPAPAPAEPIGSVSIADIVAYLQGLVDSSKPAFFLVDLEARNIYKTSIVTRIPAMMGNMHIMTWDSPLTFNDNISAFDWNGLSSTIPFCTVDELNDKTNPIADNIKFYARNAIMTTCDAVVANGTNPKNAPPPFNLVDMVYNLQIKKTIGNIVEQKRIAEREVKNSTTYQANVQARVDGNKHEKHLKFLNDLQEVGCVGNSDDPTNILGDKCDKIAAIKKKWLDESTIAPYSGGRSKRNKHRRNKRTVSRRGCGHKRSRRVDGGSRKCGKKCRRKHTRK